MRFLQKNDSAGDAVNTKVFSFRAGNLRVECDGPAENTKLFSNDKEVILPITKMTLVGEVGQPWRVTIDCVTF